MKSEEKDNVVYSFAAAHKPVAELSPGEILVVETADSFDGQIQEAGQDPKGLDWTRVSPATGPFYIKGAEPGDALEVEIIEIKTDQAGVAVQQPGTGVLNHIKEPAIKLFQIGPGSLLLSEGLSVPCQPWVSIIGVAPTQGEALNSHAGIHGGKLWCREVSPGSKIILPVFHAGANFALGDVLVLAGDGALSGSGIGAGATVKFKIEIIKGMKVSGPQVTTGAGVYFLATDSSLEKAIQAACRAGVEHICRTTGLAPAEAYFVAGAMGQLGFCRALSPYIVKFFVPSLLKVLPGEK